MADKTFEQYSTSAMAILKCKNFVFRLIWNVWNHIKTPKKDKKTQPPPKITKQTNKQKTNKKTKVCQLMAASVTFVSGILICHALVIKKMHWFQCLHSFTSYSFRSKTRIYNQGLSIDWCYQTLVLLNMRRLGFIQTPKPLGTCMYLSRINNLWQVMRNVLF